MTKKIFIFLIIFLGILSFLIFKQGEFNKTLKNINLVFAVVNGGGGGGGGIVVPTVATYDATKITACSAILNGEITNTGGENANLRGFEWGTTSGGPYPNGCLDDGSGCESGDFGLGTFSQKFWGFTPGVTYYFRAKAHNSKGWGYGSEKSFKVKQPNLYGWAWSENIGWISFNYKNCEGNPNCTCPSKGAAAGCPNLSYPCNDPCADLKPYGVYLPPTDNNGYKPGESGYYDYFSCYAWSPNIGWIRFDPPDAPSSGASCTTNSPSFLSSSNAYGLIRACAGAANPDCTGGPNPAAGGFNGWICLSDSTPILYEVNYGQVAGNEFSGWAWGGGGTSTQNAVVGWISFNCSNRGVCTAATAEGGPSNYKVYYQPENLAPTVSNAQITGTNYCTERVDLNGVQKGQIGLSWSYLDDEGDSQDRYWLQIATDSGFNNKVIDCQVPDYVFVAPGVAKPMASTVDVVSSTSPEYANRCNDGGDLGSRTLAISYGGGPYYWQVASKAATGNTNWSNWAVWDVDGFPGPDSFTTKAHAYPWVNFHWVPSNPIVGENVNFYDDSSVYGGATKSSWYWVFTDATPSSSTSQNPTGVQFNSYGSKSVSLTVEDSDGAATADPTDFKCTASKTVKIGLPPSLPEWKEIPPF